MLAEQQSPVFLIAPPQPSHRTLTVLLPTEAADLLQPGTAAEFLEKEKATTGGDTFVSVKECRRYAIEHSCNVRFSKGVEELPSYWGLASGLLATAYTFSLKTGDQPPAITVSLSPAALDAPGIVSLANALVRSVILANGRGDDFGSPAYFVQKSKELAA